MKSQKNVAAQALDKTSVGRGLCMVLIIFMSRFNALKQGFSNFMYLCRPVKQATNG